MHDFIHSLLSQEFPLEDVKVIKQEALASIIFPLSTTTIFYIPQPHGLSPKRWKCKGINET